MEEQDALPSLDDEAPAEEEEEISSSPTIGEEASRRFLYLFLSMTFGFFLWAAVGTLDVVSIASSEVVPSGQVKQVQHLEGGIVSRVLVREGETVKAGQPLAEMQATAKDSEVKEMALHLINLQLAMSRSEALLEDRQPHIPPELAKSHPELVAQSQEMFQAALTRFADEIKAKQELVSQRRHAVTEVEARLKNDRAGLNLLQEQIRISESLLKSDLTNRYNHLDLLKEASKIKSSIEENESSLKRSQSALKETEAQLAGLTSLSKESLGRELEESRRQFQELSERLPRLQDSLHRTILRAPVAGVIKSVLVVTEGGVIPAGGTVLEIVPADDRLIIEAKLPTQDVGYVRVGQKALIKLSSTDARRFGNLEGEVIHVSADTFLTEEKLPYYRVRIATNQAYFENGDQRYDLHPGMILSSYIVTGSRTILEYILSPLLGSFGGALGER